MGLLKTVELPSGVTVGYWRIIDIRASLGANGGSGIAVLGGYIDEDARRLGREPVVRKVVDLSGEVAAIMGGEANALAGTYSAIKAEADWSDATDVLVNKEEEKET